MENHIWNRFLRFCEESKETGELSVIAFGLPRIPPVVYSIDSLIWLDLSFNSISSIDANISNISSLKYLYLHHNPITSVSPDICHCANLNVVDLSNTLIIKLPFEISRISSLHSIFIRATPLEQILESNDIPLLEYLRISDAKTSLSQQLAEKLLTGLYFSKADDPAVLEALNAIISSVSSKVHESSELRTILRHSDRLFPELSQLQSASPVTHACNIISGYLVIKRSDERKQLGVALDLKLRSSYSSCNQSEITLTLESLMGHLPMYDDVNFLVKYASILLPPMIAQATPDVVIAAIRNHQQILTQDRDKAVFTVLQTLKILYPDQQLEVVDAFGRKVCQQAAIEVYATKKELKILKALASNAQTIFPAEISKCSIPEILSLAESIEI